MDSAVKSRINALVHEMDLLCHEAADLCDETERTQQVDHVRLALHELQKRVDFAFAVTTDQPPGDWIVELSVPGEDDPVKLLARWNAEAETYGLVNVPIHLAPVARVIERYMSRGTHHGLTQFSWSSLPVELAEMLEGDTL